MRHKIIVSSVGSWEDAKLALQEYGNWVKNADTKTTVLAAATSLLISVMAANSKMFVATIQAGSWPSGALSVLLLVFVVASFLTARCLFAALTPRTTAASLDNRFSWPAVASKAVPPTSYPAETLVAEAWEQCHTLAQTAAAKYRSFYAALRWFAVTVVIGAIALVSASWTNAGIA